MGEKISIINTMGNGQDWVATAQVLVGKRALHQEQVLLFLLWEVHMVHQQSMVMWLLSRRSMMMVLSSCLKQTMVATLTIPLEKSLKQIVPSVLPIRRNKEVDT